MEQTSFTREIVRDLTLKAMEMNMIRMSPDEFRNPDQAGKAIADLYNAILDNIKK